MDPSWQKISVSQQGYGGGFERQRRALMKQHFKLLGLFVFVLVSGCRTPGPETTESVALPEGHEVLAYLAIGGVT